MEIYWLNWSFLRRGLRMLLGRKVDKEAIEPYYLRYITSKELRDLLRGYLGGGTAIRYNEVIFYPELRLTHRLRLAWLDHWIGRLPLLNQVLARQIVAKVHVRP